MERSEGNDRGERKASYTVESKTARIDIEVSKGRKTKGVVQDWACVVLALMTRFQLNLLAAISPKKKIK